MQNERLRPYAVSVEDQRLTVRNITRIELDTTVRLSQYIAQAKNLTESGTGTGRYAVHV